MPDPQQAATTAPSTPPPAVDWQSDPDFHALPIVEKDKVLRKVDPDYAGLPPQEQQKALNVIHYGPPAGDGEGEGFLSHAAGVIGNQIKSVAALPFRSLTEGYKGYSDARDKGAGVLDSLGQGALRSSAAGVDPLGITEGMLRGTADTLSGGYQKRRERGYNPAYAAVAPTVAPAVGVNLPGMEDEASKGHVSAVAAEGAVPAAEVLAGSSMRIPAVSRAVEFVTAPIARAMRSPIETFAPRLAVPDAPKALNQAIQPGVNIPRAAQSIDIAGPRLQQVRQATGMEFKSPGDLLEGVKAAKGQVWDAIEQRMGPVAQLHADTSPVAQAMESAISKRTETQFPAQAKAIRERAATYRNTMSLRDIENAIQDANDDLKNFYKRGTSGDSPTSAGTAATEAEVKALRSLLDQKVEKLSGAGVSDLKREYGALRDVEKATAKANAVATRQKGATTWEGLAALKAAGDVFSGNPSGLATMAVGRWLGKLRDPNFLIDRAFQGSKAFKPAGEIPPAPGPSIRGALSSGPLVTPQPADTSGSVPYNAPRVDPSTRAQRLGLLLPEGKNPRAPLVTPPPEGQRALPPQRFIQARPVPEAASFRTIQSSGQIEMWDGNKWVPLPRR
jgi:hypothetical protein